MKFLQPIHSLVFCVALFGYLMMPHLTKATDLSYASVPSPQVLQTAIGTHGGIVLAVDISATLEAQRVRSSWDAHLTAAVGRLMSVATAMAILHPDANIVTIRVEGNGRSTPVVVSLNVRESQLAVSAKPAQSGWSNPDDKSLLPSIALGKTGTLSINLFPPKICYSVPLVTGEIGNEFANLLSERLHARAAAITGEYFYLSPPSVKGSGLVLVYFPPPTEDAELTAAEVAVNRFGKLSERIRTGQSLEQWLAVFSEATPQIVELGQQSQVPQMLPNSNCTEHRKAEGTNLLNGFYSVF